ncbi:MAG: hypothetical protein Q8O62_09460 [Aequorivita sp.]|nr:hypothetical protein [Aequorivita sp.]
MKNIIVFVASLLFVFQGFSQKNFNTIGGGSSGGANNHFNIYLRIIDINEKAISFGLSEAEFNGIKEEAYLNSNFMVGNIYQDENLIKAGVPMRYNAYADEIEIKNHVSEENYGALMKDESIYVKIEKDIYVFIPFDGSNEKGGYFNIIADGKTYDLYKKTKAVFEEPYTAATSYEKNKPASFTKESKYYLMKNGTLYELPDNTSSILKMMEDKKQEVKVFVKKNNLDLHKEEDLSKIVLYFDSLL